MADDVGAIRAQMVLETDGFKTSIDKVKRQTNEAATEAKKTKQQFSQLSASLSALGLGANEIKKINNEIRMSNPKLMERQLSSVETQLKKIGASSDQIAKVKTRLTEIHQEAQKAGNVDLGKMKSRLTEINSEGGKVASRFSEVGGILTGLGGSAVLAGLFHTVQALKNDAQQLNMSMQGLTEVSKALGQNIGETTGLSKKFVQEGIMGMTDSANAIKTALSMNLSIQQTEQLIRDLADSAAYNRASYLTMSEAVVQGVQAIKMGNSELLDNTGIVENLSVMQNRYAKSIGTTADKLTEQQKVMAALNGVHQASALFAGNAAKVMEGYAGTEAYFTQTVQTARAELGEAFMPILQQMMATLGPLIVNFTTWATANKEVIAGLAAGTATIAGIVAAVGTLIGVISALRVAFVALGASIGPVGLIAAAITTVAAGIFSYKAASDSAAKSQQTFAKSQEDLNKKLSESPLKRSAEDVKNMKSYTDELNDIVTKRNKLEEEYKSIQSSLANGPGDEKQVNRLFEISDGIEELDKKLKGMDFKNVDEATKALARLREEYQKSIPARVQLEQAEVSGLAVQVEHISTVNQLKYRYQELSRVESLSEAQKSELATVVQNLVKQYPELLSNLDQEGRWSIKNIDILDGLIGAEKDLVTTKANGAKQRLEIAKQEATAQIQLYDKQLQAMLQVAKASAAPRFLEGEAADAVGNLVGKNTRNFAEDEVSRISNARNELQASVNQINRDIANITVGNYDAFKRQLPSSTPAASGSKKSGDSTSTDTGKSAAEIQEEMQRDAYRASLAKLQFEAQYYDQSEQQQIDAYEQLRANHADYLANNVEDERSVLLEEKRLRLSMEQSTAEEQEKLRKDQFENSTNWIDAEERRMREKGSTETEITVMQLEAWTRVRDRYEEDSDYYKRADREMYTARMALMKQVADEQDQINEQLDEEAKDLTKKTLENIKKQEKAELDSIDRRRSEIEDYYAEKLDDIDTEERSKDRAKLISEIEKYRYSTSKEGQEKLADLQDQLDKMDTDEKKRQLEKQRDDKLDALDKQKEDVQDYYSELEDAFSESAGNIETIEKLMHGDRLTFMSTTNTQLLAQLEDYVRNYNDILAKKKDGSGKTGGTGTSVSSESIIINKMKKNSAAWDSADAETRRQLENANKQLGQSIGATYNAGEGTWYKNGVPLYHSGGVAGEYNFMSGDRLMPDELIAVLQKGEITLTKQQIASLITGTGGNAGTSITVQGPLIAHDGDVKLEDSADIKTYWSERELAAQRLLAEGIR